MIIKERKEPLILRQLLALKKRLPSNHPKLPSINDYIKRYSAGYKGECSIDYYLSLLDEKKYYILHDLRLADPPNHFQMDTLILSKKFALILEVKNFRGELYFDSIFHQLIQKKEDEIKVFADPLLQLQRQENQLEKWLLNNGFNTFPIFSAVVIANTQTKISTDQDNTHVGEKVIHREFIPAKLKQLEKLSQTIFLQEKELKRLTKLIRKQHTPHYSSVLEKFQINEAELLKGVRCPSCSKLPLLRIHSNWYCKQCHSKHKDAHLQSLQEYYLLINSSITSSKLRGFIQISSYPLATRILKSLHLPSFGITKGKVYQLKDKE
ncbi:nuclease-related domain-containing protein [Niallia nealsonii]|uniref:NERD domain-containing protein n=1 Tax=Niallia nealsonii TaxID=115979 RepID=A0A2N0YWI4_9BACI|nr:nuclease-related domain-containing protein [Niallia nealsonii]PKG21610.1 hypothetical protein CWS01_21475 [Niallia nealsonii]